MMVDEYTSTKNPNINKYNGNPVIPLKIKNHNIALPLLTDRIKKNNIKNFEKLFISNILNSSRKTKSKSNEILRFYHPWLSNMCKNEEINSFMSYCYGITKITSPAVKINKIKINDNKYQNSHTFQKDDKHYKMIKILNRKKFSNVGTNTCFDDELDEKRNLNIENNNKEQCRYKFNFYPFKDKIISNSFRSSYITLKNQRPNNENKKNSFVAKSNYVYLVDTSRVKNNRSSLINNNNKSMYNQSNDETIKGYFHNDSTIKSEYRTIKIKKIKNNDRYIDKKIFRDTFRIGAKFKY